MYSKEYATLLSQAQDIGDKYKRALAAHQKKIDDFRETCTHEWRYCNDVYDKEWICLKCEKHTHLNPHKKPIKSVHILTEDDRCITIWQLDKKYPQGWKRKES